MLKLEELKKDAQVQGLLPNEVVRLVQVKEISLNARLETYRNAQGKLDEQTLFRSDEHRLPLATAGKAWAFDADPASFKLALEAYCISLAHLFGPMMSEALDTMIGVTSGQSTIAPVNLAQAATGPGVAVYSNTPSC